MTRYSKFLVYIFIVLVLLGCKKDDVILDINENISIELKNSFIHFAAGIETRGALITNDVLTDNFSVVGYQYPGDWKDAKSLAVPNVFKYRLTDNNGNIIKDENGDDVLNLLSDKPQIVNYDADNGFYEYDPIQNWTGNKYSFFGYYPSVHDSITLFGDENDNIEGDPYFMYTLPIFLNSVDDNDHTSLIDLMTAATIDTRFGASPNGVLMTMHHRLAAVDVAFRNYSKHNYTINNPDGEEQTVSAPVRIQITGCKIKLSNIVKKAKVFLDHSIPTYYIDPNLDTSSSEYQTLAANIFGQGEFSLVDSPVDVSNGDNITPIVTTNKNATLFLIPQREHLTGSLTLLYKKEYLADSATNTWTPILNPLNSQNPEIFETGEKAFSFNRELVQGQRYYIEVTFTSNAITLQTLATSEWNEFEAVKHEFE